jgi:hypothetical protein
MFFLLSLVYLSIGGLGELIFYFLFPTHFFKLYFVIILFYWIVGITTNFFLDRTCTSKNDKLLTIFMLSRMVKFFLTIVFLAVMIKVVFSNKDQIAFAIAVMANYVLYTSLELYIYYLYNKRSIHNAKEQ